MDNNCGENTSVALEESLAYLQTEGEHVINCPSYDLDYIVIVAVT